MNKRMEGLKEYRKKVESGEIKRSKPLDPIEKSKANPKSYKFALYAKCYDCCCFNKDEIKKCTAKDCPLYDFRPYQDKKK